MSFNQSMHGSFPQMKSEAPSFSFDGLSSFMGEISEESLAKIAAMQTKLSQKLGPEYLSQRPGPGGGPKLTYAEGWKIINLANEVFGFNGWSSNVVNITTDFCDENQGKFSVGVTAVMRITLRDGVYHEDVGFGGSEGMRQKGASIEKAKKEAITDGVKRTLRSFGNLLGNCLYDKTYTSEVTKIKIPPAKFNKDELYRGSDPNEPRTNAEASASTSNAPQQTPAPTNQAPKPLSSLPAHLKTATNTSKGKSPAYTNPEVHTPQSNNTASGLQQTGLATPETPVPQRPPAATGAPVKRVTFGATATGPDPFTANDAKPNAIAKGGLVRTDTVASDNSFDFGSQDDAFLAAVDLDFEGDMGRPIIPEEVRVEVGAENGSGGEGGGKDEDVVTGNEPQPFSRRTTTVLRAGILDGLRQRSAEQEKEKGREHEREQQRAEGRDGDVQSARLLNIIAAVSGESNGEVPSNTTATNANQRAGQNGNSHLNLGNNGFQSAAIASMQARATAGTKRSSDVMLGTRRPVPGMGLSAAGARREPLTSLELNESGEVKRMRR